MTQEEFNALLRGAQDVFNDMLNIAVAQGIGGGTYTSKYSGEEMDALLDKVSTQLT